MDIIGKINFKDVIDNIIFADSYIKIEYGYSIYMINAEYIRYNDDEECYKLCLPFKDFIIAGNTGLLNNIKYLQIIFVKK